MMEQRNSDAGIAQTKVDTAGTAVGSVSYLERNIKELLTEFPALGDVLNAYNIGCVACTVGTCQLKDIVQFHSLPEDQLRALLSRIARTIDPDGAIEPPCGAEVAVQTVHREINYSPPLKSLVREHALIKRWLALIPDVIAAIDLGREADRQLLRDGIDFIRSYADQFHHAKEEDILFKHFDERQEIIRVMREEHLTGRNHVKAMVDALETRDSARLAKHLDGYRKLLTEHINKEDEILYPWMDRQFTTSQIGDLFREFSLADSRVDPGMTARFEQFIERLEQRMKGNR